MEVRALISERERQLIIERLVWQQKLLLEERIAEQEARAAGEVAGNGAAQGNGSSEQGRIKKAKSTTDGGVKERMNKMASKRS